MIKKNKTIAEELFGNDFIADVMRSFNVRETVAKEAYRIYIGNSNNLNKENLQKANAFCMGARYQRELLNDA